MRQLNILLITSRPQQLHELVEAFRKDSGVNLTIAATAQQAVDSLKHSAPVLTVVDDPVDEMPGLDLVRQLIEINAFIHTAVLSDESEEAFHCRSEGLGILARLPMQPGAEDVHRLMDALRRVLA